MWATPPPGREIKTDYQHNVGRIGAAFVERLAKLGPELSAIGAHYCSDLRATQVRQLSGKSLSRVISGSEAACQITRSTRRLHD